MQTARVAVYSDHLDVNEARAGDQSYDAYRYSIRAMYVANAVEESMAVIVSLTYRRKEALVS